MKYYVQSGDLRLVIDKPSGREAARVAINRDHRLRRGSTLGLLTSASQYGFDETGERIFSGEEWFSTADLLDELGLADKYGLDEATAVELLDKLDAYLDQ